MASEYAKITWEQYGELIETLWQDLKLKLDQHKVHIDAIIPILREGAFTGIPLAYKLNTYKVLPIQYKYLLHDGSNELVKIADLPEVQYEIPSKPVFLLCDTYPCGGKTKELAVADVKCKFKDARFVFASLLQDDTANKIDGVLFSAYAISVDAEWKTTNQTLCNAGISNAMEVILPWENEGEEVASVESKKWEYN